MKFNEHTKNEFTIGEVVYSMALGPRDLGIVMNTMPNGWYLVTWDNDVYLHGGWYAEYELGKR